MADLLSHWVNDGTVTELASWQARAMANRHRVAAETLGSLMPDCHGNSLHLWIRLPEGWTEDSFVEQARLQGVAVAGGRAFRAADKVRGEAIRVSLGSTRAEDLRRGLSVISAMLRDVPEALLPTI
jgi:DNA-binding transcriptional MocR family regulator